ncbi:MAG: hypothetical protein B7X54_07835 [Idiomarina sp. 34-48-12]|nr:MAG: hypothetical protein B7X54_07835 [Idiomarina sp. 34-48-12]
MPTHLIGEVIKALNQLQQDYQFVLEPIAPNARYLALSADGCCDLMLFEDVAWGWVDEDIDLYVTKPLLVGRERFVALKHPNRDQRFFEMKGLRFGGIVGYHYPFAANEKDHRILEEKYGIYLGHSHRVNLQMLLNERLDLVMLSDEYLAAMVSKSVKQQLLISKKPYGVFNMATVINKNKNVDATCVAELVERLKENGKLNAIFKSFKLPAVIHTSD